MDRFVGGRKCCNNDMHSRDLNRQIKEADILKQAAEILGVSKADASTFSFFSNLLYKQGNERRAFRLK